MTAEKEPVLTWPDDSHRLAIIGQTGSGKSQAGAWHLSRRSFDHMPWTILDPKRDKLLKRTGAKLISLYKPPPTKPGLYRAVPVPGLDDDAVDAYMRQMMKNGDHGLYVDEAYSMPRNSDDLRRILTQGRAKHVPTIICTQRPVLVDRFVWSEASFFQYFWLNSAVDRKSFRGNISFDPSERLPKFHSHWYDVGQDARFRLSPVPDEATILRTFRERLKRGFRNKV